jgi:hypothetical protein
MTDGAIIIAGDKWVLPGIKVHTWHDHGMTFEIANAPRRLDAVRQCVLHWVAAERDGESGASQIHRTLVSRGLSVEFAITNDGTIWQFVDPVERRCRHCSRVNPFSVGVEVSGVGWVRPGRPLLGATTLRRQYEATIHGWKTRFFDYLPAQQDAVNILACALTASLDIEPIVMTEPWERRKTSDLKAFSGYLGHFQAASLRVKYPKTDPGTAPLESLKRFLLNRNVKILRG